MKAEMKGTHGVGIASQTANAWRAQWQVPANRSPGPGFSGCREGSRGAAEEDEGV